LFWPFAYYDIYDYTLCGDGIGFWGYGYRDIYAAIFTPYGYEDVIRHMSSPRSRRHGRLPSLTQIRGDDASEFADFPIKQFRQAIMLSEEQRATLDDLANASVKAAQIIRAACLAEVALTASGRLAAMQQAPGGDEIRDRICNDAVRDILRTVGRRRRPEGEARRVVRSARTICAQGSGHSELHAARGAAVARQRDRGEAASERLTA
jgi:hypothetical protein